MELLHEQKKMCCAGNLPKVETLLRNPVVTTERQKLKSEEDMKH